MQDLADLMLEMLRIYFRWALNLHVKDHV